MDVVQLGHNSISQYWLHNSRKEKINSIEDQLNGCSKPHPDWDQTADPRFERSLIAVLAGDQTVDTSGWVINLNMNTAFKCVSHILGNLQFLQTVAELCADAHYYFANSFNTPWGSKASSICSVRWTLTPWATRVGLILDLSAMSCG